MWSALILTGWLVLLGAPSVAVFGLAVPAARHGARVRRLALICAALVLAAVAGHRVMDIFLGPLLIGFYVDAFNVDREVIGVIPGVTRAYHEARVSAIATTRLTMAPVTAVLFFAFFGLMRIPSVRGWLYGANGDVTRCRVTKSGPMTT